jgi:AAA+ superfamily predicted ATPase
LKASQKEKMMNGKDISAKMVSVTLKPFAAIVAEMEKVTREDLEKVLPDYVSGAEITKLFR